MPTRRFAHLIAACALVVAVTASANAYVAWDSHVFFLRAVTKDLIKLLPRAMGLYLYENEYDFMRGITFMTRDIRTNPFKLKDLEEIRREAYERLNRDIPYCVEAFKGGDIKLDTSANNLAGRLGMIAYSLILVKMPAFPDLEYLERFSRALDSSIGENLIDIWLFYDGYGDFHSLGELMERLREETVPEFRHARNDKFPVNWREDPFAMFRAPLKFEQRIILTDVDINDVYNQAMNGIMDAFVYIWKCSGMDLAHPSYMAPPGTVITRPSRRRSLTRGILLTTVARERGRPAGIGVPPPAEEIPGAGAAPAPAPPAPPERPQGPPGARGPGQ